MKYILPKSGANLVQFSGRSECPLLKWSHMQDSIDGLEFLMWKKLFTKLRHPRDPKHLVCGDKFALTVPLSTQVAFVQSSKSLCRVQPRFLQAFAFEKEVRIVRVRKHSSSNLQSCKCISIKVTPDQTEIDRVLTSKAPVLPQGTCVRSLVHTIVCSHTWDSKVASSIFTVCVCSLAHIIRSFLHTYAILRRLCNYAMVRQVVILCMLSILIYS